METNVCPKTWMAESILVTILCCLPFGIIGIVNAAKVSFYLELIKTPAAFETQGGDSRHGAERFAQSQPFK